MELEVTKVVNEGFVFFVNSKNPVDNLKLEDIVKIYSGKINLDYTNLVHNAEYSINLEEKQIYMHYIKSMDVMGGMVHCRNTI